MRTSFKRIILPVLAVVILTALAIQATNILELDIPWSGIFWGLLSFSSLMEIASHLNPQLEWPKTFLKWRDIVFHLILSLLVLLILNYLGTGTVKLTYELIVALGIAFAYVMVTALVSKLLSIKQGNT